MSRLVAALERRFAPPEWVLFREVGNATGMHCRRHADAVAMNLWPSRGMELVGFEIKSSRSDWLREMANPEKAEAVMQYCERWYLVVDGEDVARAEEIPVTWGFLVLPDGKKLHQVKEAPLRAAKPIDRGFVASLLRHAHEQRPGKAELELARREAADEAFQRGLDSGKAAGKGDSKQLENLKKTLERFEAASGIHISEYDDDYRGEELGQMVKLLDSITSANGGRSKMNTLLSSAREAHAAADLIERVAREMIAVLHPKHPKAPSA